MNSKNNLNSDKADNFYRSVGEALLNDPHYVDTKKKNSLEIKKKPSRTSIINFLLSLFRKETVYLEIGVRNPDHNFNHISAHKKYSVDPGYEFKENPVDFKITSDDFFKGLESNEILHSEIKFDVIFIDGSHHASQVDKDILNSIRYIQNDGFVVLHDCNPPSEWHTRSSYNYIWTPAGRLWNGTTWKAFLKWRFNSHVHSCCIDSDWGVGILSKNIQLGNCIKPTNPFFEFQELDENRTKLLNLKSFEEFKNSVTSQLSEQN